MGPFPKRQLEKENVELTLEKMVGESRAAVLRSLEGGRRSVGDIVAETRLSQPNVSNHLGRLRELGLVEPRREGRRIYYTIVSPDLVRALLSAPSLLALSDAERERKAVEIAPLFERAVLELNHEATRRIVDRALAEGFPWQDLYTRVFAPTLVRIGDLWESDDLSIEQEHAASQLIHRLMGHVAALRVPARSAGACDVVVTCAEGERHEIGARMAADFLAGDGLNVVFLGADTPNDAIIAAVSRFHPSAVIVSATTLERAESIRALSARWASECNNGISPALMVGGRIVQHRPDLSTELGVTIVPADPEDLCKAVRNAING